MRVSRAGHGQAVGPCFPLIVIWRTDFIFMPYIMRSGPGSSVGIATDYGLDGPGIESRWGARFSVPVQTGPPSLLYNEYRVFPGGKVRPGCDADPSTSSSAEVLEG